MAMFSYKISVYTAHRTQTVEYWGKNTTNQKNSEKQHENIIVIDI